MANWNAYDNARKRTMPPMGRKSITDADVIIAQEEEIERYREKIRNLEEKLRELEKPEPWGFGDLCKVNLNGEIISFNISSVSREESLICVPQIEIKGTIIK